MIEIYCVILLTLLCVLGSGFFLGYSLGRVHGTKDALESKQEAEEFIRHTMEETK